MEGKYIKIKEASEMLGVSKLTLRNWDKAGKLLASRHPISNYRVYKTEDIEKILEQIESGEKPVRPLKIPKSEEPEKPKIYKINVVHLKD